MEPRDERPRKRTILPQLVGAKAAGQCPVACMLSEQWGGVRLECERLARRMDSERGIGGATDRAARQQGSGFCNAPLLTVRPPSDTLSRAPQPVLLDSHTNACPWASSSASRLTDERQARIMRMSFEQNFKTQTLCAALRSARPVRFSGQIIKMNRFQANEWPPRLAGGTERRQWQCATQVHASNGEQSASRVHHLCNPLLIVLCAVSSMQD